MELSLKAYSLATEVKPYVVFEVALVRSGTFGEPDAVKAASPVRRGTVGNVLTQVSNALAVYPTQLIGVRIPAPQPFTKPSLSECLASCPATSRQ
jgi:hypothetical protein